MFLYFKKNKNSFNLLIVIFSIIVLFFQYSNRINFYDSFYRIFNYFSTNYIKNYEYYDKIVSENINLKKEKAFLLKTTEKNIKKNNEFNNKKYSKIDVIYINNNQNGNFIIGKTLENLSINDVIVDKEGFLVGRVVFFEKKSKNVKIQLITDLDSNFPVSNIEENIYGFIKGTNDTNCVVELNILNKQNNTSIRNGDIIITSNIENLFPKGIIVGDIDINEDRFCIKTRKLIYSELFSIKNVSFVNSYANIEKYDNELEKEKINKMLN